jgi:hypothetical protein
VKLAHRRKRGRLYRRVTALLSRPEAALLHDWLTYAMYKPSFCCNSPALSQVLEELPIEISSTGLV